MKKTLEPGQGTMQRIIVDELRVITFRAAKANKARAAT